MRRILTFVFSLVCLSVTAFENYVTDDEGSMILHTEDVSYVLNADGTADTWWIEDNNSDGEIYVHSEVEWDGKKYVVDKINFHGSSFYSPDTKKIIIEGCNEIVSNAFEDFVFDYLQSVTVRSRLKVIDDEAFYNKYHLRSIELPSCVTKLGDRCFYDCSILRNLTLPSSLTTIGTECFSGCHRLEKIEIPSGVAELGYRCFYDCKDLTNVVLPQGLKKLGDYCFYGCEELTNIELSQGLKILGDYCFYGCEKLTKVVLSQELKKLGDYCFHGCKSLANINLPSSMTELGVSCFCGCESLTTIAVPSGVSRMGDWCFSGCSSLSNVDMPSHITELGNYCFAFCTSLKNIVLPSGVSRLGEGCFHSCLTLKEIEIPYGIVELSNYCFRYCTSLTSIVLPSTLTKLGDECFYRCENLKDNVLTDYIEEIGTKCFYRCPLGNIEIPQTVRRIGDYAFENTDRAELDMSRMPDCIFQCKGAFWGNRIKSVNWDTHLENVCLPDYFMDYYGDEYIYLPDNYCGIGKMSFGYSLSNDNNTLYTVSLRASSALKEPQMINSPSLSDYMSLELRGKSNEYTPIIDGHLIYASKKKKLLDVQTPYLNGRKGAVVPEGVEVIGDGIFRKRDMCSFSFPSTTKSIEETQYPSEKIITMRIYAKEPPSLTDEMKNDKKLATAQYEIYVPAESLDKYRNAPGWSLFYSRIYPLTGDGIEETSVDMQIIPSRGRITVNGLQTATKVSVYGLDGSMLATSVLTPDVTDINLPSDYLDCVIVKVGDDAGRKVMLK